MKRLHAWPLLGAWLGCALLASPSTAGQRPAAPVKPSGNKAANPAPVRANALPMKASAGASPAAAPKAFPHAQTHPRTIKIKPFTFDPPEPRREVLPNGLVIYLLEDHDLPVFSITAYTKVGSLYAPQEKAGLAGIAGTVLRTGGTETRTGDQIDQDLEFVGAAVETGIGMEYGTAGAQSLIKDRDLILGILNDLLRRPAFREDKIELARAQAIEGIRRQNDDPNNISAREFARLVYGRESPYAQVPTISSLKSITRQDLLQFHRRFYHPNNTIMAVSGAFKADEMLKKLRETFGSWERSPVEFPKLDPLKDPQGGRVFHVARDLPQTVIRMGHLGISRLSPDRPAVAVLNEIFGSGGFTSRLMREVRSNRGLAYSVWGVIGVGPDRGLFTASAQTKSESAVEAAQLIRKMIADIRSDSVTEEEVRLAKESILNSYIFQFDSPSEIVRQKAELELLGYPPDWMETYPKRIQAVTPSQVQQAAQKYFHPDQMVFLVVGGSAGGQPPLSSLGTVTPLTLDPLGDPSEVVPDERKVP